MGEFEQEYKDFTQQLEGDIPHDFGSEWKQEIGEKNDYAKGSKYEQEYKNKGLTGYSEDKIVDFFIRNGNSAKFPYIKDHEARRDATVVFEIPDQTDMFQTAQLVKLLPEETNEKVGIVHDAGSFITNFVGAKNFITFGSVMDPAFKPDDDAIWYNSSSSEQKIGLKQFGFLPSVIDSITIRDFKATIGSATLQCDFNVGNKIVSASKTVSNKGGIKRINDSSALTAGYLASIAQASSITGSDKYLYYIGKTLGDTSLVASCMPMFKDNDGKEEPNQLLPQSGSTGQWKLYKNNQLSKSNPEYYILKTIDRLNHLRAFMKNVGSVLEKPASKKENLGRRFEYIPGIISNTASVDGFTKSYANLKKDIETRYDTLLYNLNLFLDGSGKLKDLDNYSTFPGDSPMLSKNEVLQQQAGKVIQDSLGAINILKQKALQYIDIRIAKTASITEIVEIKEAFQQDLVFANYISPRTLDPLKNGKCVLMDIIVAQFPPRLAIQDCEIDRPYILKLRPAFDWIRTYGKSSSSSSSITTRETYTKFITPANEMLASSTTSTAAPPEIPEIKDTNFDSKNIPPIPGKKWKYWSFASLYNPLRSFTNIVFKTMEKYISSLTQKGGGAGSKDYTSLLMNITEQDSPINGTFNEPSSFSTSQTRQLSDMVIENQESLKEYLNRMSSREFEENKAVIKDFIEVIKTYKEYLPRTVLFFNYLVSSLKVSDYDELTSLLNFAHDLLYFNEIDTIDSTIQFELKEELKFIYGRAPVIDNEYLVEKEYYTITLNILHAFMCSTIHSVLIPYYYNEFHSDFSIMEEILLQSVITVYQQVGSPKKGVKRTSDGQPKTPGYMDEEATFTQAQTKRVRTNGGRRSLYRKFTHKTRRNKKNV